MSILCAMSVICKSLRGRRAARGNLKYRLRSEIATSHSLLAMTHVVRYCISNSDNVGTAIGRPYIPAVLLSVSEESASQKSTGSFVLPVMDI